LHHLQKEIISDDDDGDKPLYIRLFIMWVPEVYTHTVKRTQKLYACVCVFGRVCACQTLLGYSVVYFVPVKLLVGCKHHIFNKTQSNIKFIPFSRLVLCNIMLHSEFS
jgi:hypothetical protein